MDNLDIIIDIQEKYNLMASSNSLSVSMFKHTCLGLAKKYNLTDDEFFKIARDKISLSEMRDILNNSKKHIGEVL